MKLGRIMKIEEIEFKVKGNEILTPVNTLQPRKIIVIIL